MGDDRNSPSCVNVAARTSESTLTHVGISFDNTKLDPSDRQALTHGINTALRRLHVNLGHPTNDDLTRCLAAGGGNRVSQRAVKCLRCSTCERMSRAGSHRPSGIPTDGERFDERLFVDLCDLVDVRGNRYWWLVAVDQHTDCTVVAPCPSHESEAGAKKIFEHWTRWAGPPGVLVCDGDRGLGASEIFTEKLSVSGAQVQTTAAYSPWQKGRAEQRIATIKEVAGKTILQHQVAGRSAMLIVSYEVAHALNQRAGRLGISSPSPPLPSTRVFGQRMKVCSELMEHGEVVPHPKVMDEGDELARRFIIRASAREVLEEHAVSEANRGAAATRSWPMNTFEPGTLCFFYGHYPGERAETAMQGRYLGPAALIGPHGRSGWWVRFGGRAYLRY